MNERIVELTVRNHPGVMSNITGLFARRGFNLEGILCSPVPGEGISRIFISLNREDNCDQVFKQLHKLYDVLSLSLISEEEGPVHLRLRELWQNVRDIK
jgi:acetolactate synthase-1/3 small subunit